MPYLCSGVCFFHRPLPPSVNALVHYDHMNGHSEMVIERVSKDDSGTYTCLAENSVGTIKSLAFVYVKGKMSPSKSFYCTYETDHK